MIFSLQYLKSTKWLITWREYYTVWLITFSFIFSSPASRTSWKGNSFTLIYFTVHVSSEFVGGQRRSWPIWPCLPCLSPTPLLENNFSQESIIFCLILFNVSSPNLNKQGKVALCYATNLKSLRVQDIFMYCFKYDCVCLGWQCDLPK